MITKNDLKTDLILYQDLVASHSLDTREEPHEHLWKIQLQFSGSPQKGRIIDFPLLEKEITRFFQPYQKQYLNSCNDLNEDARMFPTCETLGAHFFMKIENEVLYPLRKVENPTLILKSILISLYENDGKLYGSALTSLQMHSQ